MANVTQSLFGFTPQDIQAQRQAELDKRATAFAQLDPMQQAQAGFYRAGSMFGDVAASALGYEDPQVAQARARQGLLGGLDMNDPESLLQAAKSIQATDPEAALALVNQANTLQGTQSDINKKKYDMEQAQVAYQNRFRALKAQFPDMTDEVAVGLASDEAAFRKAFEERQAKVSAFGQQLIDAGLTPGSPEYQAQMRRYVEKELTPSKSIGDQLAAGLSPLVGAIAKGQAVKAGEAGGTEVGKAAAKVGAGYRSLDAISDALETVESGIYGGGYGPLAEAASKYTFGVVGNKERLVNTEAFRAYIGNVVIPMMQQLGGSDSNEELKKMEAIAGGNTQLEPEAIKRILNSARKAIKKDLARLEKQQEAVTGGKPLPLGPVQGQDTPRVTKRLNPATGKLEKIKEQ